MPVSSPVQSRLLREHATESHRHKYAEQYENFKTSSMRTQTDSGFTGNNSQCYDGIFNSFDSSASRHNVNMSGEEICTFHPHTRSRGRPGSRVSQQLAAPSPPMHLMDNLSMLVGDRLNRNLPPSYNNRHNLHSLPENYTYDLSENLANLSSKMDVMHMHNLEISSMTRNISASSSSSSDPHINNNCLSNMLTAMPAPQILQQSVQQSQQHIDRIPYNGHSNQRDNRAQVAGSESLDLWARLYDPVYGHYFYNVTSGETQRESI